MISFTVSEHSLTDSYKLLESGVSLNENLVFFVFKSSSAPNHHVKVINKYIHHFLYYF